MIDTGIERRATELLLKHNAFIAPVPIEVVAAGEGAQIARNHFNGNESGFAMTHGTMKIIGVNTATSPRRQRFTIAHELGHLDLHAPKLIVDHSYVFNRDGRASQGTHEQEIAANAFAAALLMPRDLVVQHLQVELKAGSFQSRDELIGRMARIFDVSNEAMGYRMINLNIISA